MYDVSGQVATTADANERVTTRRVFTPVMRTCAVLSVYVCKYVPIDYQMLCVGFADVPQVCVCRRTCALTRLLARVANIDPASYLFAQANIVRIDGGSGFDQLH